VEKVLIAVARGDEPESLVAHETFYRAIHWSHASSFVIDRTRGGRNEFTIAITEYESTARIMLDSLRGSGDNRAGVVIPTPRDGFNGEGGALSRAGVPTLG
jgi:hypothetical protein